MESGEERSFDRIAGWGAILSGTAWVAWAILNGIQHGGLDAGPPAVSIRVFKTGELLTGAWNLLQIPAALALWSRVRDREPSVSLLWTISGVLSVTFWAFGGLTHSITPALETAYLFLAAVWWLGMGYLLRSQSKALGNLTIVLGCFTSLDFAFTFFEPVPFAIYLLAAPKLPLAVIWSFCVGAWLIRSREMDQATSARPSL